MPCEVACVQQVASPLFLGGRVPSGLWWRRALCPASGEEIHDQLATAAGRRTVFDGARDLFVAARAANERYWRITTDPNDLDVSLTTRRDVTESVTHLIVPHSLTVCFRFPSVYRVAQKNGATLSHCKYSENSITELRGNWWTSAILYAEHSH